MALLTLLAGTLAFGALPLLDRATLSIQAGERLGLVGRNGTGKSSLLGVIAGRITLDDGELRLADGTRIAMVEQEPELPAAETLTASLVQRGGLDSGEDDRDTARRHARLAEYLHRFELDGESGAAERSGGERKRAALALALALEPDLLLLDEPTNHLDIAAIETLEQMLLRGPTSVVISHDRRFLDRVVTRIVELDRGLIRSYPGNFADYERLRAAEIASEALENRRFDKFWAAEEVWIRKGVEARRTRSQGRVQRLEELRSRRAARRERPGTVRLGIDPGARSGKLVAELVGVGKRFGERAIVRDLDLTVLRGDRVGLVGPNGAGKTTLLGMILGRIAPDRGEVRLGTKLNIAYFDQMREQLDPDRTVADTISPGSDWVETGGQRRHITGYLADYLFPPRSATAPVRSLSGGERNRLLLARLFAQPANLLVLDEPTNDLDIESLELLESTLQDYPGTLLLVSHDRAFLDNVVTETLFAEGDGRWVSYVGGYNDLLMQREAARSGAEPAPPLSPLESAKGEPREAPRARRERAGLSFREQQELDALPSEIEALEREQAGLEQAMADPGFYRRETGSIRADQVRHETIAAALVERMQRWEALERRSARD